VRVHIYFIFQPQALLLISIAAHPHGLRAQSSQKYVLKSQGWLIILTILSLQGVVCDIQASYVRVADSPFSTVMELTARLCVGGGWGPMSWMLKRRCRARRARTCMGRHGNPELELGERSEDLGVSIARMS
jgi:hypothetical protein